MEVDHRKTGFEDKIRLKKLEIDLMGRMFRICAKCSMNFTQSMKLDISTLTKNHKYLSMLSKLTC